jgi:UDP-N-acetylglucosamine:LPS N-acetylglucosamine transferase
MKIGIVNSGGGHLDETLPLLDSLSNHDIFLVTYRQKSLLKFKHPHIKETYFIKLAGSWRISLLKNALVNLIELYSIFKKEHPVILFSTGSEIAILAFFLGKCFFRTKLIFLETVTRPKTPSFTARVVYPIADLFLVQWETLLDKFGPKAQYKGRIL